MVMHNDLGLTGSPERPTGLRAICVIGFLHHLLRPSYLRFLSSLDNLQSYISLCYENIQSNHKSTVISQLQA